MKDQPEKTTGFRFLDQEEVDLINEINEHGEKTQALLDKLGCLRSDNKELITLTPCQRAESMRCLSLAKTNLQQGQMWFVRAVALPNSF